MWCVLCGAMIVFMNVDLSVMGGVDRERSIWKVCNIIRTTVTRKTKDMWDEAAGNMTEFKYDSKS